MTDAFLERPAGRPVRYTYVRGKKPLCAVYLHGLLSSRQSRRAESVRLFAKANGLHYLSLDYTAHGETGGEPHDFRIGQCLRDACDVIQALVPTLPLVLVGSSLGGWIAFLLAEKRPEQVKGILGLAAGVDFMEHVWENLLTEKDRAYLMAGHIAGPSPETKGYCFSYPMFEEARRHLLLRRRIAYAGEVILLHGDADNRVRWERALQIKDALLSERVQVSIVKGLGHQFTTPADLALIDEMLGVLTGRILKPR